MRGDGRIWKNGNFFWCCYYLRGEQFRENTHSKDEKEARKFLQSRIRKVHADREGGPVFETPAMRRLTVHDLLETLKAQFQMEGQDSSQNLSHLKRADDDFGKYLAVVLKPDHIDTYKMERLAKKNKPASINRPLQMMRQAFLLAVESDKLARAPRIKFLSEKNNVRKGFCEETEFRTIYEFLPSYLKDFCLFGYCTGMRFGEIRSLKWEYVKGDVIELQAEDAKGDGSEENARLIPMVGKDLAGILERRKAAQTVTRNGATEFAALIFHHNGKPVVDIRKAWKSACKKAGVPNRLFHDLRRSCAKNLDEAGISRDVAMSITGHRSEAMWHRYNISDVKRKRSALERVQMFRDAAAAQDQKIVAMR